MKSRGELYLYQTIHTLGGVAPLLELHVDILNNLSEELFELTSPVSVVALREDITNLLHQNNAPLELSVYIRLELFQDGKYELMLGETSIYKGYSLRCIEPKAAVLHVDLPLGDCPISSTEHMAQIEQIRAQQMRCDIAIRSKINGEITAANNAPLYGVINKTIYTPPKSFDTAERRVIERVIAERYTIGEQPLQAAQLSECDELFFVDHYGVTAIKRVENREYMNIVSNSIARLMAEAIEQM